MNNHMIFVNKIERKTVDTSLLILRAIRRPDYSLPHMEYSCPVFASAPNSVNGCGDWSPCHFFILLCLLIPSWWYTFMTTAFGAINDYSLLLSLFYAVHFKCYLMCLGAVMIGKLDGEVWNTSQYFAFILIEIISMYKL